MLWEQWEEGVGQEENSNSSFADPPCPPCSPSPPSPPCPPPPPPTPCLPSLLAPPPKVFSCLLVNPPVLKFAKGTAILHNAVFKTNNSFGLGQKCYLDVISINIFQKVFLPLWREPWPVVAMALILRKLDNNGCGICFHVTDVGTTMMSKCHALLQPLQLFPCIYQLQLWRKTDLIDVTGDDFQTKWQTLLIIHKVSTSVAHHLVGRLTN